jgi:predicted aspartyl protease
MARTSSTIAANLLLGMLPCIFAAELTVEPTGANSRLLTVQGDALFQRSEFDAAESAYKAALRVDARNARASWGLGRLASLRSQTAESKKHFAQAFQMDPRDPDIILSYAGFVQDPEARTTLLRNFLALSGPGDTKRREHVVAQLEIAERLGARRTRVASSLESYHFRLADLVPAPGKLQGLLLTARINGGKPLRLLLDSGAEGIYLSSRAAKKLDLESVGEARIAGLGQTGAVSGQVALARTLSIDAFQLENPILHVMDFVWLTEADGVIGTDVFEDFLVRIDAQKRTMDLVPYSAQSQANGTRAYRVGHYLLVEGSANNRSQGYFMVDTGASSTVIASKAATSILPDAFGQEVNLRDARGPVRGGTAAPASLHFGGRELWDGQAVALDLTDFSKQAGVEILGVLGFPALRQSPFTINYRDGWVEFTNPR